VIFRRARFAELIERQLDLFVRDHRDVVAEAEGRLELYNRAARDEAEELYGDYVDAVETGTELLADVRDTYARTLDEHAAATYEREFNRAVAKRLPPFGLELENR
jgi:isocitrate dehydrogenase kinase/phosphatase